VGKPREEKEGRRQSLSQVFNTLGEMMCGEGGGQGALTGSSEAILSAKDG